MPASKICFQGELGSNSHEACKEHFPDLEPVPCATFEDAFDAMKSGQCGLGMIPVENSIGGIVSHTLDALVMTRLTLCGEVMLPVHHHLLSTHAAMDEIEVGYAHPQSFAQCRPWLDARLPTARRDPVSSPGQGARRAGWAHTQQTCPVGSARARAHLERRVVRLVLERALRPARRVLVLERHSLLWHGIPSWDTM